MEAFSREGGARGVGRQLSACVLVTAMQHSMCTLLSPAKPPSQLHASPNPHALPPVTPQLLNLTGRMQHASEEEFWVRQRPGNPRWVPTRSTNLSPLHPCSGITDEHPLRHSPARRQAWSSRPAGPMPPSQTPGRHTSGVWCHRRGRWRIEPILCMLAPRPFFKLLNPLPTPCPMQLLVSALYARPCRSGVPYPAPGSGRRAVVGRQASLSGLAFPPQEILLC